MPSKMPPLPHKDPAPRQTYEKPAVRSHFGDSPITVPIFSSDGLARRHGFPRTAPAGRVPADCSPPPSTGPKQPELQQSLPPTATPERSCVHERVECHGSVFRRRSGLGSGNFVPGCYGVAGRCGSTAHRPAIQYTHPSISSAASSQTSPLPQLNRSTAGSWVMTHDESLPTDA